MDYEPWLCDLVRAIDLTLIAPVEPEVALRLRAVATLGLALERVASSIPRQDHAYIARYSRSS
jgi:hypothetical protein